MTTPEQLAKWREEFEALFPEAIRDVKSQRDSKNPALYWNMPTQYEWQGYLLAKQENEQANAISVSKIDIEIIREATEIILDPSKLRHPIVDELEGIALMLEAQSSINEQPPKVDDHQIDLLVNSVTHIASVYHDNGSLRQRISSEIVPTFQQAIKDARKQALEEAFSFASNLSKDYASAQMKDEWQVAAGIADYIERLLK